MMHSRTQSIFIIFFILFFIMLSVPVSALSVEKLLMGYAENDIQLKELDIKLQQAMLEAQKTALENGVNIILSTGDMEFDFSSSGVGVSVSPELSLSLPSLNNTTITATTPVTISTSTSTRFTDADVKVSTDIISDKAKNRKLTIEKAERTIEIARRTLENHVLAVETAFWKALQALFGFSAEVLKAQDDLISDQTDFDTIKVQGYSDLSTIYRTAELTARTAEYTVEEKQRLFEKNLAEFLLDCGFDVGTLITLPELPAHVDKTELLEISDFDPALYAVLDESLWNADFNEKLRDADDNFVLSANAGYDHTNLTDSSGNSTRDKENSVNAGVNATWNGLSFGAGVSLPLEEPNNPKLVLGLSWDMNEGKLSRLSDEEKQYATGLDNLAVEKAQDSWIQQLQTSLISAIDLDWQRQRNAEELALYEELYTDTQSWYAQGIVSALDLLQTKTNYEQALYKSNSTALDILIYNLELRQLFIEGE